MRTELWGLRDKETHELILTYWASSQKHKALFATKKAAVAACVYNPNYEPFRIESKEGKWKELYYPMHMILTGEERLYVCSACTAKYDDIENKRYCPWCGAKMDLEVVADEPKA